MGIFPADEIPIHEALASASRASSPSVCFSASAMAQDVVLGERFIMSACPQPSHFSFLRLSPVSSTVTVFPQLLCKQSP